MAYLNVPIDSNGAIITEFRITAPAHGDYREREFIVSCSLSLPANDDYPVSGTIVDTSTGIIVTDSMASLMHALLALYPSITLSANDSYITFTSSASSGGEFTFNYSTARLRSYPTGGYSTVEPTTPFYVDQDGYVYMVGRSTAVDTYVAANGNGYINTWGRFYYDSDTHLCAPDFVPPDTITSGAWASFIICASKVYIGYIVSIASVPNGKATASVASSEPGATINVTFTPDSGYAVDWDNTTITAIGAATVLIKDTDTTGHFTMPAGDVTINPAFKKILRAGVEVSGYGGQATVSNEHPEPGEVVTITTYPNDGYAVDTVTSFDATISMVATNQYVFTMPNVDVLATVTFKEVPYVTVTVEPTSNGSITASPMEGYSGTNISLSVTPNAGYQLRTLYVLAGTDSVPVTKKDDTHYTFTLPSFNVVVRSIFNKIGDTDPYSPGGNSEPSTPGGTGTFDNSTMPITPPSMPVVSITDTGLYTIFSLTKQQLNDYTNYLWSNLFSLDTVSKYLNNATDHILSLHLLPFTVKADYSREIRFMGIGTGTSGFVVSNQYQQLDCGYVKLEEYYGSALDYNPWTKLMLYVPYCGEIALDPDEVMNQTIGLKYTVDILTGDCYANVSVGGTTMYQMSGNCALRLPVSASNWSQQINAVKSALALATGVGSIVMGAVGAGLATLGVAANQVAIESGNDKAFDDAVMFGRAGQAVQNLTPQSGSTNSYMSTMAGKSSYVHTGIQTGGAGFMAVQVPYILIKRPRQSLPENFNNYVGYPAHYTRTLGHMTGFTTIIDWNPSSIPCTESERWEIDRLLKTGVIL